MTVNGEIKILWAMSLIALMYVAYLICTPNPEDGTLLIAVVAPIAALAGGVMKEYIQKRRLKTFD